MCLAVSPTGDFALSCSAEHLVVKYLLAVSLHLSTVRTERTGLIKTLLNLLLSGGHWRPAALADVQDDASRQRVHLDERCRSSVRRRRLGWLVSSLLVLSTPLRQFSDNSFLSFLPTQRAPVLDKDIQVAWPTRLPSGHLSRRRLSIARSSRSSTRRRS